MGPVQPIGRGGVATEGRASVGTGFGGYRRGLCPRTRTLRGPRRRRLGTWHHNFCEGPTVDGPGPVLSTAGRTGPRILRGPRRRRPRSCAAVRGATKPSMGAPPSMIARTGPQILRGPPGPPPSFGKNMRANDLSVETNAILHILRRKSAGAGHTCNRPSVPIHRFAAFMARRDHQRHPIVQMRCRKRHAHVAPQEDAINRPGRHGLHDDVRFRRQRAKRTPSTGWPRPSGSTAGAATAQLPSCPPSACRPLGRSRRTCLPPRCRARSP